jgi:hypothetical protein
MISLKALNYPRVARIARGNPIFLLIVLSGLICSLLSLIWFSPYRSHSFIGDDLVIVRRYQAGTYATTLKNDVLSTRDKKFRPVGNAVIGVVTRSCKLDFDCYENTNLVLYILNGILFAFIVYRLSGNWLVGGILSSIVYVLCRFSFFFFTQIFGLMENIGNTFALLFLYAAARFIQQNKRRWFWLALAATVLATFSHERYIVLIAPLCLLPFWGIGNGAIQRKLTQAGAALLFLPGYALLRVALLHVPLFVGTGGTLVTSTFSLPDTVGLFFKGFANLVGLNAVPDYLGGINYRDAGRIGVLFPAAIVAVLAALVLVSLAAAGWKVAFAKIENRVSIAILVVCLGLIAASSVTIRLEYRWLLVPYMLLVMLVIGLIAAYRNPVLKYVSIILILGLLVANNVYFARYAGSEYFITGQRIGDSVRKDVLERYTPEELSTRSIVVVVHGNPDIQSWTLGNAEFFSLYTGIKNYPTIYVNETSEIQKPSLPGQSPLVIDIRGVHAEEIQVPGL